MSAVEMNKDRGSTVQHASKSALSHQEEVEIKLELASQSDYLRVKQILGAPLEVHEQENVFFDGKKQELSSSRAVLRFRFYGGQVPKCILTLKSNSYVAGGIQRSQEVEEDINYFIARQIVVDSSKMGQLRGSQVMAGIYAEYKVASHGFVCLGGFRNRREVYQYGDLHLELDKTTFEFGTVYEIEVETANPVYVKSELESLLNSNGVKYTYSKISKFARFVTGKQKAAEEALKAAEMKRPPIEIDQQVVFVYTDAFDSTVAWYENVLGLELILDQGQARIYRTSSSSFLGVCKVRPGRYVEPKGVVLTLATKPAAVDQWFRRLSEQGADILGPPERNDMFNVYAFFVRDPNGYLIEFQSFLDPRWPLPPTPPLPAPPPASSPSAPVP